MGGIRESFQTFGGWKANNGFKPLKALLRKVPVRGVDNIIEQLKSIEILLCARHV